MGHQHLVVSTSHVHDRTEHQKRPKVTTFGHLAQHYCFLFGHLTLKGKQQGIRSVDMHTWAHLKSGDEGPKEVVVAGSPPVGIG
eukprot:1190840-Prorocentrum_minimum.AAC.3